MDSARPSPSIKASASKLPIKRKTPIISSFSSPQPSPNPNSPSPLPTREIRPPPPASDIDDGSLPKAPPYKFHRIWTESEEIRFLECLLDCTSQGLSFPKDLNAFYSRFSSTMSQPYSKSQLSEKLRRLRKKFRILFSRISGGLDASSLSPHDRSLYEISGKLWQPDQAASICASSSRTMNSNLVGVEVSFSPTLPSTSTPRQRTGIQESDEHNGADSRVNRNDDRNHTRLSDVNVEFEDAVGGEEIEAIDGNIGEVAGKIFIDVFEHCLKDVRTDLSRDGFRNSCNPSNPAKEGKLENFDSRWRNQKAAELDVLARRLRLVHERSFSRQ